MTQHSNFSDPKEGKKSSYFFKSRRDVHQFFEDFKQIDAKIHRQLEEVYQKTGWTPQFLKAYLENPNNFTEAEWIQLQKERQLRDSFKFLEDRQIEETSVNPSQRVKERRGKAGRGRRHWIPMR